MSPSDIFAQRFKMARLAQGYTLRKLAEILGFSHNTIHKYEKGMALPDSNGLIKIATSVCRESRDGSSRVALDF